MEIRTPIYVDMMGRPVEHVPTTNVLVGDSVEVKKLPDGKIKEIFVRANGVCVFHMERVGDNNYQAVALDHKNEKQLHMRFSSPEEITGVTLSEQAEAE